MNRAPSYDADFYSDAFIRDPLRHYAAMRALGPVVYLPRHDNYAVVRYKELRQALRAHATFRSGEGVAADAAGCSFLRGNTLASDPPVHDRLREAVGEPLRAAALEIHRPRIEQLADELVSSLCDRGRFDAVADVARHLPLTVVTELVGLPPDGRENMLEWAAASFNILGIQNCRGRSGIETIREMRKWILSRATADRLKPGSWTARIHDLCAIGTITADMVPILIRDYINPSLDTTIAATSELLRQLALNPDQWELIRARPELIPAAVDEAVRLATPIRSFARHASSDTILGGVEIPAGARVMMVFASANRDPLHFADPDKFDVGRANRDHVGFGHGIHVCVGMHLARLEMESLLKALAARVRSFEIDSCEVAFNNTIRSYASMPMTIVADAQRAKVSAQAPVRSSAAPRWIDAKVVGRTPVSDATVEITIAPRSAERFPVPEPGSHIDVELAPGLVRQYSICGQSAGNAYKIAVQLAQDSKGGSRFVHERVHPGRELRISSPRNAFELDTAAARYLLIAGGIGITPLLSMAERLHVLGKTFLLAYRARSAERAAYVTTLAAAPFADKVRFLFGEEGRAALSQLVAEASIGTAVYCCGPHAFMREMRRECLAQGVDECDFHIERFQFEDSEISEPFVLIAARSGMKVEVGAGETMLEALERFGIEVPSYCLSGLCGTCLAPVIKGIPDHRDTVQSVDEKLRNDRVALCCSRSFTSELVVDL